MARFNTKLEEALKEDVVEPRYVIEINFGTDASPIWYKFTSHTISGITGNVVNGVVEDFSSVSQTIVPNEGRSEIGAMKVVLVDVDNAVSTIFNAQLASGKGLAGKTVVAKMGAAGFTYAELETVQTQTIQGQIIYSDGAYTINCADRIRTLKKELFVPVKTKLSSSINATATTIPVYSTVDFELNKQDANYGIGGTASIAYFKIKYDGGFEVISATGMTTNSLTGVTRGLFNTKPMAHTIEGTPSEENGIDVEQMVYLEEPAPKLLYRILTGQRIGSPADVMPSGWHLGIDPAYVDISTFDNSSGRDNDWHQTGPNGFVLRFENLAKTDGKSFCEKEFAFLLGAFLQVGNDGKIRLIRQTGVIAEQAYVAKLNPDNTVNHNGLTFDAPNVRNVFNLYWGYEALNEKPDYGRLNTLKDGDETSGSIGLYGAKPAIDLKFKGLHPGKHAFEAIKNHLRNLRSRNAGPPALMSVQLLPEMAFLQVGEIVRCQFPDIWDKYTNSSLDRSFEIQQITIDRITGKVTAKLFGSTLQVESQGDSASGFYLSDSWYSSAGTSLASVAAAQGRTIDGAGNLSGPITLTGANTVNGAIYYHLGDFTNPAGNVITVVGGNIQLRIRGFFTNNGTIDLTGAGAPAGVAGAIGNTEGNGGVKFATA